MARRPPFGRSVTWILTDHELDTDGAPAVSFLTLLVGLFTKGFVFKQQSTVVVTDSLPLFDLAMAFTASTGICCPTLPWRPITFPILIGFYLAVCKYRYVSDWQCYKCQFAVVCTELSLCTDQRPPFGWSVTWILTSYQVDTDGAPAVSLPTLLVGLSMEWLVYRQQSTVVVAE